MVERRLGERHTSTGGAGGLGGLCSVLCAVLAGRVCAAAGLWGTRREASDSRLRLSARVLTVRCGGFGERTRVQHKTDLHRTATGHTITTSGSEIKRDGAALAHEARQSASLEQTARG